MTKSPIVGTSSSVQPARRASVDQLLRAMWITLPEWSAITTDGSSRWAPAGRDSGALSWLAQLVADEVDERRRLSIDGRRG